MLIDNVIISLKAGRGGRGAVAFNKNMMSLGPTGASGGNGGNIFFEGTADLGALGKFRYKKELKAKDGENGKGQFNDGARGGDLILEVPVGTVIHNLDTSSSREIIKIGEKVLAAKGGEGGRGNFHFRSSTNTSPRQYEDGKPGQEFRIRLELKLIADIGLIGLPNAGKSSLLNELTAAKSKVANYPFTTLEPNLGAYFELIIADIPGLIEGASSGKGLGIKFLRHVERTKILFHLVSAESTSPVEDYRTIRKELKKYHAGLLKKPEYLFISKSDTVTPAELKKKVSAFRKIKKSPVPISIHDWESINKVKKILTAVGKTK